MSTLVLTFGSVREDSQTRSRKSLGLRALSVAFLLSFFAAAVGCSATPKVKLPHVVGENPSARDLVQVVNQRYDRVKTLYVDNGSIGEISQPGTAKGTIFFVSPNKFRLIGTSAVMGGRVLDCGSDGQKFWFWNGLDSESKGNVYTCSVANFHSSELSRIFPLDPTWFPEALGVMKIDENDVLEGPSVSRMGDASGSESLVMKIKRQRPDGVYTERVYFEPLTAAVIRQDVQGPDGRTIATVRCKERQYIEAHDLALPRRVEISCPASNQTFTIDLGVPTVNGPEDRVAFEVPRDVGARQVDLNGAAANNAPQTSAQTAVPVDNNSPTSPPSSQATQSSQPSNIDASQIPEHGKLSKNENTSNNGGIVPFPTSNELADVNAQMARANVPSYEVIPENRTDSTPIAVAQTAPIPAQVEAARPIATTSANGQTSPAVDPNAYGTAVVPQTSYTANVPVNGIAQNNLSGTIVAARDYIVPPTVYSNNGNRQLNYVPEPTLSSAPVNQRVAANVPAPQYGSNAGAAAQVQPQTAQGQYPQQYQNPQPSLNARQYQSPSESQGQSVTYQPNGAVNPPAASQNYVPQDWSAPSQAPATQYAPSEYSQTTDPLASAPLGATLNAPRAAAPDLNASPVQNAPAQVSPPTTMDDPSNSGAEPPALSPDFPTLSL